MASTNYYCPDCGNTLTWDSDGSLSGAGFPCWYCTECGNIVPPDVNFPAPTE